MQKIFWLSLGLLIAAVQSREITEDFSTDPLRRGWEIFGTNNLITWSAENQNLQVTWDSSQPNHYFRLPLETVLQRNDDFTVSLDLSLQDFTVGVTPTKPATFQMAFGFQNFTDASKTNFHRAASGKSPNLVEFNFLPDSGFGPTVWPAIFSTNSGMNYSGASDFSIFDLPTGTPMRVSLAYTATNETATITITANGQPVGPITRARLATNDVAFGKACTNFQLDTCSISSYTDAGCNGSLLAHGTLDNIVLAVPPPAISDLIGRFINDGWQVTFSSHTNWTYELQRSSDFLTWNSGEKADGTSALLTLHDTNSVTAAFYRVFAQRVN
jgi:hypothetical protein